MHINSRKYFEFEKAKRNMSSFFNEELLKNGKKVKVTVSTPKSSNVILSSLPETISMHSSGSL